MPPPRCRYRSPSVGLAWGFSLNCEGCSRILRVKASQFEQVARRADVLVSDGCGGLGRKSDSSVGHHRIGPAPTPSHAERNCRGKQADNDHKAQVGIEVIPVRNGHLQTNEHENGTEGV